MIKEVEFPSEGATLRGLLFLPQSQAKRPPLVIMAHATSATVYMVADRYAEAFSRAGLAALLYDHRNFGGSGGEPRQEINPWIQCRGYLDAVKFAETHDQNHPTLWALFVRAHTLLTVAPEDEMMHANCPVARQAYELVPGPTQWYDIAGGHSGPLYYPSELFDETSGVQTEYLKRWL